MRVAVAGATGLIGARLVERLVGRGDEVVALVRGGRGVTGARVVEWDGASELPAGGLAGCDAVVNLAGASIGRRWTAAVKREIATSRVDLTERLVAAMAEAGVGTLVSASAVGYYGPTETPVDEAASAGDGFLADVCRRWEAAAFAAGGSGIRVVVLRTGIVLAPEGGALARMAGPARLGMGGPIAGGRQWLPWIHIDDAIELILLALDDGTLSGPINLVAPGIVRQGDFAAALGRAVNRPAVVPVPGFAIRAMLGEGAQLILQGQHVVPVVALARGYGFRFAGLDEALGDLLGG